MSALAIEALEASGPDAASRLRPGRHRDRALAAWRRSRAVELRVGGLTYEQIAQQLGYRNRGTVCRIVNQALTVREADDVDFLRITEGSRLDRLQVALWGRAMEGDLDAIKAVMKIIDGRCRLFGLYDDQRANDSRDEWHCCQGPPTVVVREDDCRHGGCDKHGSFERAVT